MAKEFWFNLPVHDLQRSKTFYKDIGFSSNQMHDNDEQMASFYIGDKNVVMVLFPKETFKTLASNELIDTSKGTEVLFNIDAQSKADVDQMAEKVKQAGGTIYTQPEEKDGWMYGCGFADVDGHRWNILYMDFSKLPKQ